MVQRLPTALLLLAAATAPSASVATQVNRCTAPDGTPVYTDRDCRTLGAMARLPRGRDRAPGRKQPYRGGCAGSVDQLIHDLATAIDAGDVNRLAALYHWPGTGNRAGQGLMDRLDRIARNPLVDIAPDRGAGSLAARRRPANASGATAPTAESPAFPAGRPLALRVYQATGPHAAPARTVFALRQHLGCWWITL